MPFAVSVGDVMAVGTLAKDICLCVQDNLYICLIMLSNKEYHLFMDVLLLTLVERV